MFSSIIMIVSLSDTLVKIKHQNLFTTNIPGLVSMLMYNNSTSPISLVYNLSRNVTSSTDLSNNFLFPNNYGIPFPWILLRNSCHSLDLILFWLQSAGSPSRQSLSITSVNLVCLFVLYIFSKYSISFYVTSNRSFEFVSNVLYFQVLLWTCDFTSLQITILKVMDKLITQTRPSSNTSIYIITTSKITGPNFFLLQSSLTTMLQIPLLVFLYSSLIRNII